jgi:hypothetical protein
LAKRQQVSDLDRELTAKRKEIADASRLGRREDVANLQEEMRLRFPNGRPQGDEVSAPRVGGTVKKDIPRAEMEKETATVTGKALGQAYEDLQTSSAASAEIKIQLAQLRELFKTPNLPEGVLAERVQNIRSGLKSLGVEVGPEVGAGDMVQAIGGKMSLLTRTADGKNLMPGAMSDFEQKILRSLTPSLNQTAEGRAALTDFLDKMADVRIRMAEEARKMADENRGILPPEWYARRDRVLKEEQARMVLHARRLQKQLQGDK